MRPKKAVLIIFCSAALTWAVAALLMNIAERKQEGRLLDKSDASAHRGVAPPQAAE